MCLLAGERVPLAAFSLQPRAQSTPVQDVVHAAALRSVHRRRSLPHRAQALLRARRRRQRLLGEITVHLLLGEYESGEGEMVA